MPEFDPMTETRIRMTAGPNASAALSVAEITHLVAQHFPQLGPPGKRIVIEAAGPGTAVVRMRASDDMLRPGGTVSGPAMFTLADVAIYIAILGVRGASALQAVTSNLSISFLARPAPRDLVAHVRLLKSGKRLSFGEVEIYSDGQAEMVAHATATYAMPGGS